MLLCNHNKKPPFRDLMKPQQIVFFYMNMGYVLYDELLLHLLFIGYNDGHFEFLYYYIGPAFGNIEYCHMCHQSFDCEVGVVEC